MLPTVEPEEIEAARLALSEIDPALAIANAATPPFVWRSKTNGFPGLVRLVLEQQVSVASANAIWQRLETSLGTIAVEGVLAQSVDQLKLLGLSGQKARYVHAIAEAQIAGTLDFAELATLDDEAACGKLVSIKGIGRWTAEAYLMGCEARRDVFPAGDIALQEAIRILDRQPSRPTEKGLYARGEKWRPYRSIAAHLLWGYYGGIKQKTIEMPLDVPLLVGASPKLPKESAVKSAGKKAKASAGKIRAVAGRIRAASAKTKAVKTRTGKASKPVRAKAAAE